MSAKLKACSERSIFLQTLEMLVLVSKSQICVCVSLLFSITHPRELNASNHIVGPPGYEMLLRQAWCYVILHNRGGSSAGS